jgi:hypothetical protein
MFSPTTYQFGKIKAKTPVSGKFEWTGDTDFKLKTFSVSCDCVAANYIHAIQTISFTVTPKSVPNHIKNHLKQDSYHSKKLIKVEGELNGEKVFQTLEIVMEIFD